MNSAKACVGGCICVCMRVCQCFGCERENGGAVKVISVNEYAIRLKGKKTMDT